jgi:Bacterial PH domain/Short C-terminal domain
VPVSSRLLEPGEEVLVDVHPHWGMLAAPVVVSAVAGVGALGATAQWGPLPKVALGLLVVVVAVPVCWLALRVARRFATTVAVTSARVLVRQGLVRRDPISVRFGRIAAVHRRQRVIDRLVGAGTIVLELRDQGGFVTLVDVRRPKAFQTLVQRQIAVETARANAGEAYRRVVVGAPGDPFEARTPPQGVAVVDTTAPGPRSEIHEQLVALDDLRRRGIVTDEEFDAKKAELLDRL